MPLCLTRRPNCLTLADAPSAETGVAGEARGGGEEEDSALNFAGRLEDGAGEIAAAACGDFDRREFEDGLGAGADEGEETGGDGVGGGGF